MKNLSEQIADMLELSIVAEVGDSENKGYSMFDDGSAECETLEFLYSFVRLIKPQRILETGVYRGLSAGYMALALKENGVGRIDTFEINQELLNIARDRWSSLRVDDFVNAKLQSSLDFTTNEKYQFMFLDSEPQLRFAELSSFYHYLEPGGFLFIHDLHRHMAQVDTVNPDHPNEPYWPWGRLPEEIKELVRQDKLRPFHFGTPRGLVGFYKTHEGDYKWS